MAKDDMEVITYKVLKYIYEGMKAGHKVTLDEMAWKCKLFDITREYWLAIMREIIEAEYVKGIKYIAAKDMESIVIIGDISITRQGREYLLQNRGMQKAQKLLGETFDILLGGLIGRL